MTKPFLSVVTISFNQAKYLRQCIDSVVSQKGDDVEYIVVDPGSTDGSREILASYADTIDHLVLERDNGPADGLNNGFARATGEVGYFINSDDFLLPGAIDRMRRLWSANPGIDVLLGGAWMVNEDGDPLLEMRPTIVDLRSILCSRAVLVQQGMSFQLERLRHCGGFNTANRTCWDLELLCCLLSSGAKAQVCESKVGCFRIHDMSISGGAGGEALAKRYRADLVRISDAYGETPSANSMDSFFKHLHNTSRLWGILKDRAFPRAMARRYFRDIGGSR
jgi:glycosyltransferase involved in cell wall biosynthesis